MNSNRTCDDAEVSLGATLGVTKAYVDERGIACMTNRQDLETVIVRLQRNVNIKAIAILRTHSSRRGDLSWFLLVSLRCVFGVMLCRDDAEIDCPVTNSWLLGLTPARLTCHWFA